MCADPNNRWGKPNGMIPIICIETGERFPSIKDCAIKLGIAPNFAFSNEQYEEERKRLVSKGFLKEDDELFSGPGGSIGTKEGFHAFVHFADEKDAKIAKECDPQEVYIYEWENHECMYGDEWRAFAIVERIFGKERASKIKRF